MSTDISSVARFCDILKNLKKVIYRLKEKIETKHYETFC